MKAELVALRKSLTEVEQQTQRNTNQLSRVERRRNPSIVKDDPVIVLSEMVQLGSEHTVVTGTADLTWTTYDVASVVPFDAVEIVGDVHTEVGSTFGELLVEVRTADGYPEYKILSSSVVGETNATQFNIPIVRSGYQRTFDIQVTVPGADDAYTVRVLGYYKSQRLLGAAWGAGSTGSDGSGTDGGGLSSGGGASSTGLGGAS